MQATPNGQAFPRGPLIGAAILVALTIGAAGLGRAMGSTTADPGMTVIGQRDMRFEDMTDGAVAVVTPDGAPIAMMPPGTNGFLRATLRGLARERRAHDLGDRTPFRLIAWAEGGLTLEDLSTGRRVRLEAFGPTNVEVFGRLLQGQAQ